jgi:hypothetical protein
VKGSIDSWVGGALEAQGVQAQLNSVLEATGGVAGVTADMANELASSLMGVTKFEDETILSGENLLLTFKGIGSDVFPAATEAMLDMSQAMGQDIKSSAIQVGKALNDPLQGMTALTRVGVTFTEEQKKAVEQMVKMGDAAGAQGVILDELQSEFGGAAKAAGETFAGQMTILKNSLNDVGEGIVGSLLPIAQKFLNDFVLPALPAITALGETLGAVFADILSGDIGLAVDDLREGLSGIVSPEIIDAFSSLFLWVRDVGVPAFMDFVAAIGGFIEEHGTLLLQILTGIAAGIAALSIIGTVVGWITGLVATIGGLTAAFTAAGGGIAGIVAILGGPVTVVIALVAGAIALLAAAWTGNWFGIRDTLIGIWETNLKPIFETVRAWLAENIPVALQKLSDFWTGVLLPAIESVWSWMSGTLMPFLTGVVFPWLQTHIPAAIQVLTDYWTNTLLPAITGIWSFIDTKLMPIFRLVVDIVGTVLTLAITALQGAWENVLLPALQAVWKYFDENIYPILESVWGLIKDDLGPKVSWLSGLFSSLATIIQGAVKAALDWILEKLQAIKKFFDTFKLPNWLTPGSPTPFELGLRGIADAMADLNRTHLPAFALNMAIAGGAAGRGAGNNVTFNQTIFSNSPAEPILSDFATMQSWWRG